jgi:hypothetical protein
MRQDILQLYNEVFFTDKQETYEQLPLTLQEMVSDWEDGYRKLGGRPSLACSRQIASLLFLFWEREQEREV